MSWMTWNRWRSRPRPLLDSGMSGRSTPGEARPQDQARRALGTACCRTRLDRCALSSGTSVTGNVQRISVERAWAAVALFGGCGVATRGRATAGRRERCLHGDRRIASVGVSRRWLNRQRCSYHALQGSLQQSPVALANTFPGSVAVAAVGKERIYWCWFHVWRDRQLLRGQTVNRQVTDLVPLFGNPQYEGRTCSVVTSISPPSGWKDQRHRAWEAGEIPAQQRLRASLLWRRWPRSRSPSAPARAAPRGPQSAASTSKRQTSSG